MRSILTDQTETDIAHNAIGTDWVWSSSGTGIVAEIAVEIVGGDALTAERSVETERTTCGTGQTIGRRGVSGSRTGDGAFVVVRSAEVGS